MPGGAKRPRPPSFGGSSGDAVDVGGGRPASPKLPRLENAGAGGDDHDGGGGRRVRALSMESAAFDDMMGRLSEEDVNLFEWFMDGEDRSGAALAYSFSGTGRPPSSAASSLLGDASDHGLDGDYYGHQRGDRGGARRVEGDRGILSSNGSNRQEINFPSTTRSNQHVTWLPYHRAKPLPIPVLKRPSSPRRNAPAAESAEVAGGRIANGASPASTLAAAAAANGRMDRKGAAVGAQSVRSSQNAASQQSLSPRLGANPQSSATLESGIAPSARALGTPPFPPLKSDGSAPSADQPGVRPPPHRWPPPPGQPNPASLQATSRHYALLHAAAHSIPKASITNATVQRSKFGFGGDHKVPSVPGPPPNSVKAAIPSKAPSIISTAPPRSPSFANAASVAAAAAKPQHPSSAFPLYKPLCPQRGNNPPCQSLPNNVGSVVAYERKKLRAKDARVQLNEAIDKLAVAIDLAGSQSKERFNYVVKITNCSNPHVTAPDVRSTTPTPPPHPLARLMDETIQQASTAKKWDRPSFVGLSATIINSLNAQCESLMREVAQLRSTAGRDGVSAVISSLSSSDVSSLDRSSSSERENGVYSQNGISGDKATVPERTPRKEKTDSLNDANITAIYVERLANAIRSTVGAPSLLQNIASYMDPSSLCKCLCVSKQWRSQHIFENADIWLNLCIKRYGVSAVRKWQDSDHDEDGVTENPKDAHFVNVNMYRHMAEKNVKPHFPIEGTLFLGGATSDGMVSCWVSLVDRSNGETSRSVMQKKIHGDKVTESYVPLSVVELRLLIQNTGYSRGVISVPDQQFTVDASTRRKGEKMLEISGDSRFKAQVLHIERSTLGGPDSRKLESLSHEMCHLCLFESAVLSVHIHARGCSTTAKFCNRSKKIQLLYSIDGTTRPLAIPFQSC